MEVFDFFPDDINGSKATAALAMSPKLIAFLFQLSWTIAFFVACLLMARVGRRRQYIVGGMAMSVALFLIGLIHWLGLLEKTFVDQSYAWICLLLHLSKLLF